MKFNFEDILELCALEIPEEKKEEFSRQVERIIEFYGVLSELDLRDVEPTTWRFEHSQELRDDEVRVFEDVDMLLMGFPHRVEDFCFVPRVLEYKKK